jgi:hypothetical protein
VFQEEHPLANLNQDWDAIKINNEPSTPQYVQKVSIRTTPYPFSRVEFYRIFPSFFKKPSIFTADNEEKIKKISLKKASLNPQSRLRKNTDFFTHPPSSPLSTFYGPDHKNTKPLHLTL